MAKRSATWCASGLRNSASLRAIIFPGQKMKSVPDTQFANARALAFLRISVGILFLIFGSIRFSGRNSLCTAVSSSGSTNFWKTARTRLWFRCCAVLCCPMLRQSHFWLRTVNWPSVWLWCSVYWASRKRLWTALYAFLAVLCKLSRRARTRLAILRRLAGSFGVGAVLCQFSDWRFHRRVWSLLSSTRTTKYSSPDSCSVAWRTWTCRGLMRHRLQHRGVAFVAGDNSIKLF